jgi:hypothetical protein
MAFKRLTLPALLLASFVPLVIVADERVAPKLADASWLTGVWKNEPGERMTFEEHWTSTAAGSMMGMFRLLSGEKVVVYEFLLIEQEEDGAFMRLRHYQSKLADVDAAPIRCRLVEASAEKLVFENPDNDKPKRIIYALKADQQLVVTVETTRNGKPSIFTLRFQRSRP